MPRPRNADRARVKEFKGEVPNPKAQSATCEDGHRRTSSTDATSCQTKRGRARGTPRREARRARAGDGRGQATVHGEKQRPPFLQNELRQTSKRPRKSVVPNHAFLT